ncbi:nucleobindin-1-like protein, partial [Leptotrombidium deliense]
SGKCYLTFTTLQLFFKGIEYGRYLQQVVQLLESDPEFKKKLENVSVEDVKSGKIAKELDLVHHQVRSKLDELKRMEVERLNLLLEQQQAMKGSSNTHLDHKNPHTFEIEDLQKLIHASTKDLERLDELRKEEFKRYEMEKELQYEEGLKNMTDDKRKEAVKHHEEELEQKKHHPRVHHPGSKQQLKEVWEEQDHLPSDEFNPHTFFAMHDVDGNGLLDEEEVKAILMGEIDKLYNEKGGKHVDETEKAEELERMREEVMKMGDTDKDRHISKDEFMKLTQDPSFEKDPEWKAINDEPPYDQHEFDEYRKHRGEYSPDNYQFYPYQPEFHHPDNGYYPPDPTHSGQQYPAQGHDPQYGHYPQQGYGQPQHHDQYPPQGHPQGYPQQGHAQPYPPPGNHPDPNMHGAPYQQAQFPQGHPPQAVHSGLPQQHMGMPQQHMGVPPQQQQHMGVPPQQQGHYGVPQPSLGGKPVAAEHPAVGQQNANPAASHVSAQGVPSVDTSHQGNPNVGHNSPDQHHQKP